MWPSRKKQGREITPAPLPPMEVRPRPAPVFSEVVPFADLDVADLHINSAELRFWIPDACKIALSEVRRERGQTAACWLREFFVAYLFGEHRLARMQTLKTGLYFDPGIVRFNSLRGGEGQLPRQETLRGLGKNIVPIKLFLPARLKIDLANAALRAGMELSSFVRMTLVCRLLGHEVWHQHQGPWAYSDETAIALAWETGQQQPDWTPLKGSDELSATVETLR